MPTQVAFLRAINVGGRIVKMAALRAHCESCGLANVGTFIASGNVIFDSRATAASLEKTIEKQLQAKLGYEVATFVRTIPELEAIVKPAAGSRGDAKNVYVGFMRAPVPSAVQKTLQALTAPGERLLFADREIYWMTPANMLDSKFSYAALERATKSPATFRNITTVTKIVQKYSQGADAMSASREGARRSPR